MTFPADHSGQGTPAGGASVAWWSGRYPDPPARSWLLAAAAAVVVGLAITVLAARHAEDVGRAVGMTVAGLSGLVSGGVIVSVARRRWGMPGEGSRSLIGLACIAWGAGQLLLTQDALRRGRSFGPGDALSSLAVPLVVVAVVRMPRRSRASRPGQRLVLDALLLTLSALMVVWWGYLRPALPDSTRVDATAAVGALMAFFDLFAAALIVLSWLRDRRLGAGAFALGAVLQAVADIHALPATGAGSLLPWTSGALWCLAWPLIALGAVRLRLVPSSEEPEAVLEDLGESRSTTIVTIVGICAVAWLLAMPGDHPSTDVAAVLLGGVVTLLVVRELLANRIRNGLVTRLGQEALRDPLTGLPNRRALINRIRSLDLGRPWVLLSVDLDGFKEINELRGYDAGDRVLRALAASFTACCPDAGMIARMGGDEFALLSPGTVVDGERLAVQLSRAVRTCPTCQEIGLAVTASIGVGRVRPEGAGDGEPSVTGDGEQSGAGAVPALLDSRHDRLVALIESTTALRTAKAFGRDRVAVYPGEVERARERRLALEWRLREAIAAGRLTMHAQPLVDLRSGEVRGFESLARWTDEMLGPVSPAEFVPIAEQAGLVTGLGDFALRTTLEEARDGGLFGGDVEIGVNVSPIQLRLPQFARMVVDLLAEMRLPPRQLVLEVTEAILIDEEDLAAGALVELAAAGIRLAIDDFGTGYSALGYLRRLPVDVLKVDRSWVVDAWSERRTRSIVRGVIDLAHQLDAMVVMEGVEDAAVAAMCLELGADLGQGWHFGRPVPWAEAVRAVESVPGGS